MGWGVLNRGQFLPAGGKFAKVTQPLVYCPYVNFFHSLSSFQAFEVSKVKIFFPVF